MTAFLPVAIRFANGQKRTVSSVAEARAAMGDEWPNKERPAYRHALHLLDEAQLGTCRHRVAFEAFIKAAREQNMVVSGRPSRGLARLDALARVINAGDRPSPYSG